MQASYRIPNDESAIVAVLSEHNRALGPLIASGVAGKTMTRYTIKHVCWQAMREVWPLMFPDVIDQETEDMVKLIIALGVDAAPVT